MGSDDPTRRREDAPQVPSFFTPDDLPAWLHDDGAESPPAAAPPRELRARAAWARSGRTPPAETGAPFHDAAGETWRLLVAAHSHGKRVRRAGGGRGRFAVLAFALPLIGGWLATRG